MREEEIDIDEILDLPMSENDICWIDFIESQQGKRTDTACGNLCFESSIHQGNDDMPYHKCNNCGQQQLYNTEKRDDALHQEFIEYARQHCSEKALEEALEE